LKAGSSRLDATRLAMIRSTVVIIFGLLLTGLLLPSDSASAVFSTAAVGVGISLGAATAVELGIGVRNIIRVDLLMLWSLYGLTLLEFLFPQPGISSVVAPASAVNATYAVLVGFAGLALGRILISRRSRCSEESFGDVSPGSIFFLFMAATLLGYLHIFLAVDFDLFEALRQMSLPRFAQSWSRGRYGGAYELLYEVGALIYLLPPIAGLIYALSREYSVIQKMIVTGVLFLTFYYGFSSGTRNILATYAITFVGSYLLNKTDLRLKHLIFVAVPVLTVLLIGTAYMLAFRNVGLGNYSFDDNKIDTLFIDNNMTIIARITELFPGEYDYLGLEIPFNGLIHPIPRVLWPDKPESLSVSIEAAMGADPGTVTFASTFVGEAYMSGGLLAVLIAGMLFGSVAELWNRLGRDANSSFSQLLYASGFLCAALSMRSMAWTAVAALPTFALWVYSKLWLSPPAHGRSSTQ
jgi:oligosaccharide repeat unit polymerase